MPTARTLWNKLPKFMRKQQTVRANLLYYNESYETNKKQDKYEERPIEEANMITSLDTAGWGGQHRPVLDLDMDAFLIESSTKGHHHLVIDHLLSTDQYFKLLDVLAEVGIVEPGFVDASKKRGATAIRLPWISKDRERDNAFDPENYDLELNHQIADMEQKLKELKAAQKADPFSGW